MTKLPLLYARGANGKVLTWQMIVEGDAFFACAGQIDGILTTSKPNYCKPKNIGRANATTAEEQALAEATAKWEKKIKEGYKQRIQDIDTETFFAPMLCKQFEDYQAKIKYPVAVELKLNGIRAIGRASGFYSRKGEQFHCIDHLLQATSPLFEKWPDLILDGELFNPALKNKLNRIASLVSVNRKAKDVTAEDLQESKDLVEYHIYDAINWGKITQESLYVNRKNYLADLVKGIPGCVFHPYKLAQNHEEVMAALKKTREEGSEGVVIKIMDAPYEAGKRSKYFLKLKNFSDAEYPVVDIEEGSGNWAGCAKRIICKLPKPTPDGRPTFDSNIRGTMEELRRLFIDRKQHIGKMATVEYQELSEYGVPLIPYTQLPFRDYE